MQREKGSRYSAVDGVAANHRNSIGTVVDAVDVIDNSLGILAAIIAYAINNIVVVIACAVYMEGGSIAASWIDWPTSVPTGMENIPTTVRITQCSCVLLVYSIILGPMSIVFVIA